jgi:hypothetical protein
MSLHTRLRLSETHSAIFSEHFNSLWIRITNKKMFLSKFSNSLMIHQNANTYRVHLYLRKFLMNEVTLKHGCRSFVGFLCESSLRHCSISICHRPLRWAIPSARQHIILSLLFKLRASSPTWHSTDYRARRFFPFYLLLDSKQLNITVHWECSRLMFSSYLIRILRDFPSFLLFLSPWHPKLVLAYSLSLPTHQLW